MIKFNFIWSLIFFTVTTHGQNKFIPSGKYIVQSSRASTLYIEKKYAQSALAYDSLFLLTKGQGLRNDKYDAACVWALSANNDKALFYLQQALTTNEWVNLSNVLSDSDLNNLHGDKRWQLLIDKVTINNKVAEKKLNKPLIALLDTIFMEDQTDRNNIETVKEKYGFQSNQMDSLWRKIAHQDSVNLMRIKYIIETYGWLGPDKVGQQGASTIFLVVQHADSLTQTTYLPVMREAVKRGNARPQDLALLEDRVLMRKGKEQIYGSQLKTDSTGKYIFYPIKDEINVNTRRVKVGLGPLEDYAKYFGIDYVLPTSKNGNK